jgi:hypothetical protein
MAGRKIFKDIIFSANRRAHEFRPDGKAVTTQKTRSLGSGFFAFRYLNSAWPTLN